MLLLQLNCYGSEWDDQSLRRKNSNLNCKFLAVAVPKKTFPGKVFCLLFVLQVALETGAFQRSGQTSAVLSFILSGNCKPIQIVMIPFCMFCIRRSRLLDWARASREDEIRARAFPTEDEMLADCDRIVVTFGIVQAAKVNNSWVVDTVSDCASGEARFDGILVYGGNGNAATGSFGCPRFDGVNVGKSNSMLVTQKVVRFHWLKI